MNLSKTVTKKLYIRGIVQGVGFRPTVYSYAHKYGVEGWVRNTSNGVEILASGSESAVDGFIQHLRDTPPRLAKVDSFLVEQAEQGMHSGFAILDSQPMEGEFLPISPDLSICPDCLRELYDPTDRRFHYPFINCTNCGPRFTIINDIPYDRPKTTMAGFQMCPDCEREYNDPLDRRFHAQPVACPVCGPQIWFETGGTITSRGEDAIQESRAAIQNGKIIAVKGLGGYLLACDAANGATVETLRARKQRSQKPFALMASSLEVITRHCFVSNEEKLALLSPEAPIVLLQKKPGCALPGGIAPGQQSLGFMLPYTPLHHLLLEKRTGFPEILVMTSGNRSEEPIAYTDDEARQNLETLADGFLMHNREINIRTDDSVVRFFRGDLYPIRRARGFVPSPVRLPFSVAPILGVGAEMKNTITVAREDYAFISHHIGDLENLETSESFTQAIPHFEQLFRVHPKLISCDLHPDYRSSRYAEERACAENIPLVKVQHHHAHLAACLADNKWDSEEPVIGVCFDGTGLGTDGAIWGGEFLLGGYASFTREYHLAYTPLPGGDAAISKPSRSALAHLWKAGISWDEDLAPVQATSVQEKTLILQQLQKGINAPPTSSIGRLFDAVSSLLGICHLTTYEGQAAIDLENAISLVNDREGYGFDFHADQIDVSQMLREIVADIRKDVQVSRISCKFHHTLARVVLTAAQKIKSKTGISTVALSGGVWQNMHLLEGTINLLESNGFEVLWHHQVPANDGSISLGQIMVASAITQKG